MSMHLLGPMYTTTKYSSKPDRKSARTVKAQRDHEEWLKKQGLHQDQLSARKGRGSAEEFRKSYSAQLDTGEKATLSNTVGNGFHITTVLENLENETVDVQMQILKKAARVAPAYNKGATMYITEGTDITTVGSKSRRG